MFGLRRCYLTFCIEDSSILLCVVVDPQCAVFSCVAILQFLSILLLMDIWIVSSSGQFWIKLLCIFLYMSVCENMSAFLLGIYPGAQLLGHRICIWSALPTSLPIPHPQDILFHSCELAFPDKYIWSAQHCAWPSIWAILEMGVFFL